MRKVFSILCVLAFISLQSVNAQDPTSGNWSKPNLLGFDTGWKFKSGFAQPEYFTRNFNDSNWQSVTYQFLDTLAPGTNVFQNRGIIRRKFYVPDSMKGKPTELFFNQFGASEIYFDGKPVFRAGNIHNTVNNVIAVQQAVPLSLDSLPWHVLSIYYASSISNDVIAHYGLRGFGVTLVAAQNESGDRNDTYHHLIISLGIIAGFALFFWFVFAFYPTRLSSLLSALMLTNFSLIFLGSIIRDINEPSINQFIIGQSLWETGFSTTYGWWLLFVYSAYYKKLPRYALIVGSMMVISILMIVTQFSSWLSIAVLFLSLYVIETWRIIIKGLLSGKTGFWIIAIGLFLSNIGTLAVIFNVFHLFPGYLTPTQTILGIANDLCFPLTLALHLAWEFGSANRDLRLQLVQVNTLSKKTLQQEQEKQQLLATQNETLENMVVQRTAALNNSLQELKATQSQLIQSEKMASLGELTAGIAHEIQNPLNFVNNFSEVSIDLIDEQEQIIKEGNSQEAFVIGKEIKDNLQKINHHGRRADSIVKNMLEHSRTFKGELQPTEINVLVDEYLRLAYHGFKAKDKSFNTTIKTDFDENIGKINIIPQELGRVLLNLFNNAFYAVAEKTKKAVAPYEPTVTVSTRKLNDKIQITVQDNGMGISKSLQDKIFQPFFTTKPTGEGTGLGLSLSYDIVKAHGGELKVESREGEGTVLTVLLPITT